MPTHSNSLAPASIDPASPHQAPSDIARRRALGMLGSIGLIAMGGAGGCGGGGDSGTASSALAAGTGASTASTTASTATTAAASSTASTTSTTSTSTGTCQAVPEETAGPYPADGSNASNATYNVLALAGIVRQDIRSNIGSSVQVAGAPLSLAITLTSAGSCTPIAGRAIYIWHCTREGTYSVYTTQSLADNHLRGVQETDSAGVVRFSTIVPGCYAGRMPHIHVEVYPSLASATTAGNKLRTTQLAFPTETLRSLYAGTAGYSQSVSNLAAISFASDNVFADGTSLEMVDFSGDAASGYSASISIAI